MLNLVKSKLPLAVRFYLTLVVPLIIVSIVVSALTFRGLQNNASHLADVLRTESKTNRILSLLLVQDDASKAMLIDPNQLEIFSAKKIEAYDAHKQLLTELDEEVPAGNFQTLIHKLQAIDEQKLRPIDSQVLEKLYEDVEKARRMYFEQYEVHKMEYETLIRELAALGADDLKKATEEMHRKNMQSLVQISLTLLLGIAVIMVTITILSRQVEKSDRNTKSLLDVLSEGLFFFDRSGKIAAERSQRLTAILPESVEFNSLHDFVGRYAPASASNVPLCLQMLWQDNDPDFFSDTATTLSLLPRTFALDDGRVIDLDYRPLNNAKGELERVVVVVADVTEKLQREKESRFQAERVKKISRAAARIDDYVSFLDEVCAIFRRANEVFHKLPLATDANSLHQLKRDLHTLKGTLAMSDFTFLASQLHELESMIEEQGVQGSGIRPKWEAISAEWILETNDIDKVLGLSQRVDRMSLTRSKFDRIQQLAKAQQNRELESLLVDCLRQPLQDVFARYDDYLRTTAEKLEKQIQLVFTPESSELAPFEVQKLDAAFNHILRNCVDHGIERPERRQELGKAPHGTIHWAMYRKPNGMLHFVIRDDGQGVNGDKLAQKAVKSGHWTEAQAQAASQQDKVNLLFLPQLSSRDEVTELSGRGVGMDAVKELLHQLGGTISVHSVSGAGTTFEMELPPQGAGADDQLRRSA